MNIYLLALSGDVGYVGYDSYDGHVVIAPDEATARTLVRHAGECGDLMSCVGNQRCAWATARCDLLGAAVPGATTGLVLSSYNAG